jgi:hypothetical protein
MHCAILHGAGPASHRRSQLSSNVRQHKRSPWCASRVSACRRILNSHESAATCLYRGQLVQPAGTGPNRTDPLRLVNNSANSAAPSQPVHAREALRSNSQSSVSWSGRRSPAARGFARPQLVRRLEDLPHHLLLRGAGSTAECQQAEVPSPNLNFTGKPSVLPNPSLKLTRYGRPCKPGPRQSYYRRVPGLQVLPPRAA